MVHIVREDLTTSQASAHLVVANNLATCACLCARVTVSCVALCLDLPNCLDDIVL